MSGKGGGGCIYILYIDRLFAFNLVMNYFALYLVKQFMGRSVTRFRLFLSALTGAVLYLLLFLLPGAAFAVKAGGIMAGSSILMVTIMYPKNNRDIFLKAMASLYGFTFLLGGALLFLKKYIFPQHSGSLWILLSAGTVSALAGFLLKRKRELQNECEVLLLCGHKQLKLKAFIDSGNMLTEPISGKPVSVLEAELLEKEGIEMPEDKCKVIPYHSVGKKNGILMGYEFEGMILRTEHNDRSIENVIIAVSRDRLFSDGRYQMLLPSKLFE